MYSPEEDFLAEEDYFYHHRKPSSSMGYAAHVSARLAAREASDHLQRLHRRVIDLEDVIRSQGIALSEKDAGHRLLKSQLRELRELKERQIRELNAAIAQLEDRNRDLDVEVKKKNEGLDDCQRKLLMLDKLCNSSLPAVEKFVANLKKLNAGNAARIKAMSEDPVMIQSSASSVKNSSSTVVAKNQNHVSDHVSDSGHPSSASDSFNIDEASKNISSLLDKDILDRVHHQNINISETPPRRPSSDLDPRAFRSGSFGGVTSSSSSSASPRNPPRNRRRNNSRPGGSVAPISSGLAMESFPTDLPIIPRADIIKSLTGSPGHSPSYTPPNARRNLTSSGMRTMQTNSHAFAHESSSSSSSHIRNGLHSDTLLLEELNNAHQLTSNVTLNGTLGRNSKAPQVSPRIPRSSPRDIPRSSPRDHSYISSKLSSEVGKILNFSDEEGDDEHEVVTSEPPPPAPPPSSNPGNTNLPSIQAPKRFLPMLSSRY